MRKLVAICWLAVLASGAVSGPLKAEMPFIPLGPADQLALDQPRVAVQLLHPETGQVIGPQFATSFLLDTGANGILAVDASVTELMRGGYQTEGTFYEQGVAGFTEFDVSALYDLQYAGSDGVILTRPQTRILSSTEVSFCPVPGFCSFYGIVGMPAMENRVTTIDLTPLGGGGGFGGGGGDDIFGGFMEIDFLKTTFADQVPGTAGRRYSVPIQPVAFDPEAEEPLPSWAELPFLQASPIHQGVRQTGNFVLDTGAQLSILSSELAFSLGLDANGNGTLLDESAGTMPIGGVGGQVNAPLMQVDELRVMTDQGVELSYSDLTFAIVDIDPTIDGIFGMNFLTSGWLGSLFGDLDGLGDLLGDAGLDDLFGDLGGGLDLGGTGSPHGFFERVHFDFRPRADGQWRMVFDLTPQVSGITVPDGTHGDLDQDGDVDFDDRQSWVDQQSTWFGDSNLDGRFDTDDLVQVFQAGQYEDDSLRNSNWATGDWNGDWEFDTKDLVVAFQDGGYRQGPRAAHAVPEPSSVLLILWGCISLGVYRRRR